MLHFGGWVPSSPWPIYQAMVPMPFPSLAYHQRPPSVETRRIAWRHGPLLFRWKCLLKVIGEWLRWWWWWWWWMMDDGCKGCKGFPILPMSNSFGWLGLPLHILVSGRVNLGPSYLNSTSEKLGDSTKKRSNGWNFCKSPSQRSIYLVFSGWMFCPFFAPPKKMRESSIINPTNHVWHLNFL